MTRPRLLVTCGHLQRHIDEFRDELNRLGFELHVPPLTAQQFSAEEMRRHIIDCDTVIAGDDIIDEGVLEAGKASRLKGIVKWGIGTDAIDKVAAVRLGLPVYNTPGMFSDEVADLAMALLLAVARDVCRIDQEVRAGRWTRHEGVSLRGKTAGVVGLGNIGRAIAARCRAFGMDVIGHDVQPVSEELLMPVGARQFALAEVLALSDFLLLACNLTPENRHLIDAQAMAGMKRGSYLINVARGPLVDEAALIDAIERGHIAGVGLDVFENEPLPLGSPLHRYRQCVFGTHGGSSTREAIARVNALTIELASILCNLRAGDLAAYSRVA
jgi:D-3-phosphoglycerate dehydrogenase